MNILSPLAPFAPPPFVATSGPTSFTDDFNRADEDPLSDGGNWEAVHSLLAYSVVSNAAVSGIASRLTSAALQEALTQTAELTLTNALSFAQGPALRMSDAGCYYLYVSTAAVSVRKVTFFPPSGTSESTLATFSSGVTSGTHDYKLVATGSNPTTLEAFVDSVSRGTVDDSSSPFVSGRPGLFAFEAGYPVDDYSASVP